MMMIGIVNDHKVDASGVWHKLFKLFVEMALIFLALNNYSRDLLMFMVSKHDVFGLIELGNIHLWKQGYRGWLNKQK